MPAAFVSILSTLFLMLLFVIAGISLGVTWVPGWTGIDAEAVALPAQAEAPVRAARQCPHCGWIESKREIPRSVADSQAFPVYEYTARRSDGSSGVFQQALPVRWRLGEQLILIDGAAALAAPAAAGRQRN